MSGQRDRWDGVFRTLLALGGLGALALVISIAGWEHSPTSFPWLERAARTVLTLYAVGQIGRLIVATERRIWLKRRWPVVLLAVGAAVMAVELEATLQKLQELFPDAPVAAVTLLLVAGTQIPVLLDVGLRFIRLQEFFAERKVSPGAVLMVTFGALIVSGTLLLKLPRATVDGLSWLDALFTSTSAVCVTGLTVVDTELAFTPTGKVILLVLIQVGGLGVMTLTTFLAALFGGVSLRGRVLLQDLISEDNLGRIGRTLPLLLTMTFTIEAIGAFAFHAAMPPPEAEGSRVVGWFDAAFHSISAFCNAGFSTWSGGLYDPVVRGNLGVQGIVMSLVVLGGLGFPVLYATAKWMGGRTARALGRRERRVSLSLHARLAWTMTLVLLGTGAIGFWLADYGWGSGGTDLASFVGALFNSVTARTAGFNISPVEALSPAAVLLMIFLMFVGGCPGSTAGGVKTTAFAVAVLNARRIVFGRRDLEAWGRRLPEETVSRALAVLFLAVTWIAGVSILLALVEPRFPLSDLVFEVVSAVSTVGLTRGVTPQLEAVGKVLIIVTMFAGRIGILYFVFAFVKRREAAVYRFPEENVLVA